jgi:hypothetical protein
VDGLLRAALSAAGDPAAGVAWIIDLGKSAPEPAEFLANIVNQDWLPEDQKPAVYAALIERAKQKLASTYGEARGWAETELRTRQFEWVDYLLDRKQTQAAQSALADIPEDARKQRVPQVQTVEIRIAAQAGTLKGLLDRFAKESTDLQSLLGAATALQLKGDGASARLLEEFVYTRQLDAYQFTASTFLGLAEIRLQRGDTNRAVELLKRMTMVTGEPFENLATAGELLNRTGHPTESLVFLADRVRAVPWDMPAKAQFAKLQVSTGKDRDAGLRMLRAVAEGNDAPYEARADAAKFLGESKAAPLATSSLELNLLSAAGPIPAASAEKPYFLRARLAAAAQASDAAAKIRLLEGAAAIAPESDSPKLALFEEAYRAKRYSTAIASLYPLIRRSGINIRQEQPETAGQEYGGARYENRYGAETFLGNPKGSTVDRGRIAAELADCYAKLNMLNEAAFYYRVASQINPSNAAAKTQLRALEAQMDLRRTNRRRRPAITVNLEQDHAVRPRLAAAAAAQGDGQ